MCKTDNIICNLSNNNKMYGVIYKITNSINNKIYFGQTKANPPSGRWNRHKYSTKNGCKVPIHNAMRLHGIENFKFEVIHSCDTIKELNIKEIDLISTNNTFCPNGYNIMKGGDNYERTDEHKKKISDAHIGKKKTPEHLEKIRLSKLGKKIKPFTDEHKKKISDARKLYWKNKKLISENK